MGVRKSNSKISRRTKRVVRKTLSGICIASALIVALIPATPTVGYQSPSTSSAGLVSYVYGVDVSDNTLLSNYDSGLQGISLDKYYINKEATEGLEKTYMVRQMTDGSFDYNWQFMVYPQTVQQSTYSVICKYNDTYASGTVSIAANIPISYSIVENDVYEGFKAAHFSAKQNDKVYADISKNDGTLYALNDYHNKSKLVINKYDQSAEGLNTEDAYWIKNYFPDRYEAYKKQYQDYVSDEAKFTSFKNAMQTYDYDYGVYQTALATNPAALPPQLPTEPVYSNIYSDNETFSNPSYGYNFTIPKPTAPVLTCWICEMSESATGLYKYFCEAHPDYSEMSDKAAGNIYVLDKVKDSRGGPSSKIGNRYVYMPKGLPKHQISSSEHNDEYGFRVTAQTSIIGIGSHAFEGTTNVTELSLAGEVKYIGDYAFTNSFVNKITFANIQDIGNRAFKDCTKLLTVSLTDTTVNIGTEAFYGCNMLTTVSLPQSISYIGPGAFAECIKLTSVDLSAINQPCNISDYAFYDDISLSSVVLSNNIARIGECCFACSMNVSGNLLEFIFPDHISGKVSEYEPNSTTTVQRDPIGNFCLAGRTNLLHVKMPSDYGKNSEIVMPYGLFYNCSALLDVTFPADGGACGYVTLGKFEYTDSEGNTAYRTMFDTIKSADFCVYGPESNIAGDIAYPRKTTWGLKSLLGNDIPYIYIDKNGKQQVEISDGSYILIIDDNGVLQSCIFANNEMRDNAKVHGLDLVIPETVGDTKVTGVSATCFADKDIHDYIKTIDIADNTISEIDAEAFKDCKMLEEVTIGNSVNKIGDSAFKGCNKLKKVTFHTPSAGYGAFPVENIGTNAFSTGAPELTFVGDINESYGPFVWATDVSNYVDEEKGVRVCYKTPDPTNLTVIVDNRNGYATLVDYPHYNQLNRLSGTEGSTYEIKDGEGNLISLVSNGQSVPNPFPNDLRTRYEKQGEEIYDESGNVVYTYSFSRVEENLINSVLFVDVPSGIESIDVNGFMNNTSKLGEGYSQVASNSSNVSLYLVGSDYYATYRSLSPYVGGLFNGFYGDVNDTDGTREYPVGDNREEENIGNDRIKSLTLHTVEYLPDYAFYSCENLSNIHLGSKLTKMGDAPFTGCNSLTGIASDTNDFICQNGIVYSENSDGTYNIVEVLSTRGKSVGSNKVRASEEDPYLSNVSSISPGAFENCDSITGVDFTGMGLLKELPDNCFKDSDKLNQVILPENITSVGHNAFSGCMEGVELVCYGREVYLPADAFGKISDPGYVESKRVVSYKDSAVRKAARDLGADVSETLDDTVKVQFFDYDGTELSRLIYVNVGASIKLEDIPKDPVREGYVFAGWNKPLTNITEDSVVVATYKQDPNSSASGNNPTDPSGNNQQGNNPSGNNNGNGNNNGSTSGNNTSAKFYTLTVTNGNGSGSYAEGATVIITCTNPPSGQVFDKWVPTTTDLGIASVNVAATTLTMPAHEASVTATFKAAPQNTSGGGNSSTSGNNQSNTKPNGNTILISKPGISNTSLASVQVTGSNDNYVVRIAETAAATAAVEKALTNEYGSLDNLRYSAMDITLYDATGTNRITNYSGLSVTITMPIPDVMTQYAGNNKVAGVVNEKLDKLSPKFTTIDGVPCVTFTATHFSPYTIYVNTNNLSEPAAIDGSPKTGDGIQPKWFLVAGLTAMGIALFFMKDKKSVSLA